MMDLSCKFIHTLPVGKVSFCCEAKSEQEVLGLRSATVFGLNLPLA